MPAPMSATQRQRLASLLASSALLLSAVGVSAPAVEPPAVEAGGLPNACLQQHVRAQELRLDSRLLEARELLRSCAEDACPTLVRTDCGNLLAEAQRAIPTLVLELSNPEVEPSRVRVSLNGTVLPLQFGQPLEVDAGAVRLLVEAPGYQAFEETLIVREGEKNRLVPVQLVLPAPPPLPPLSPPLAIPPATPAPVPVRAHDVGGTADPLPYVFGSLALVAAGTSGYFTWSALDERSRLERECAPLCSETRRRKVKNELLVADIAGGLAVAAASVTITLLVLDPGESRSSAAQRSSQP